MKKLNKVLVMSALLIVNSFSGDVVVQELQDVQSVAKSKFDLNRSLLSVDSGYAISGKSTNSATVSITYEHAIDKVSLTDWRQGYTSFFGRIQHDFITHGYESRISSIQFGPRYNFVNDTLLSYGIVPFVEGMVGLAIGDSTTDEKDGKNVGLGQDFNFTFGEAIGVKYYVNNDFVIQTSLRHFHYSNGGLSEPDRNNNPCDMICPTVSVSVAF